ncbi:MAG: STAS domain-containing protein [Acidimicrobiales bacterium]
MLLNVRVSGAGTWTILHVHGEVDMATCPELRQEIVAQIGQGNSNLVIDLSEVEFIDSTGLGVLIGGLKRARGQGGDLRVSGIEARLEKMFELTGLGDVLVVVDNADPDVEIGAA